MLANEVERLIGTRKFWQQIYWLEAHEDPEVAALECAMRFEVTPRHALTLDVFGSAHFSLGLSIAGGEPIEIAWDDQAHWHPHALSWRELDAICGAIHERQSLPHPGVPLLLLMRFAPILDDQDGELALHLTGQAWDRLQLFSTRERLRFFEHLDVRGADFNWRRTPEGKVLEQPDESRSQAGALYTLRRADNEQFPLAELERMLSSIPSSTRLAPRGLLPGRKRSINVTLKHSGQFPREAARFTEQFIDRALRHAAQGSADVNGMMSAADGTALSSNLCVLLRGDTAPARLASLLSASVPAAAVDIRGEGLPPPTPSAYVQLCNLRLHRWNTHNFRFDRPALTLEQRHAISVALTDLGLDPGGDRSITRLGDGGALTTVFPDLLTDENLDGGSVWLDTLTLDSARAVHRLMTTASLYAVPGVISSTPTLAKAIDTSWPGTEVTETPESLFTLLQEKLLGTTDGDP